MLDSISLAVKFFFSVFLPFHLGFTILVEEGPIMTMHSYLSQFPNLFGTKPRELPFSTYLLSWILKNNSLHVFIDSSDETLINRRANRKFRRSELLSYTKSQRDWLKELQFESMIFLPTDYDSILGVHKKLAAYIEKVLI